MKVEKGHTFDALLAHSSLSAEQQTVALEVLQACIQEDVLTFQLNEAHLPQHFHLTTPAHDPRSVKANYTPLLDKDQRVYEVLVTFVDISQIEIEAASRKLAQTEGETLLNFVRVPSHLAQLFVQTCQETLISLRGFQESGHVPQDLLRRLHTLKGNARSLDLAALARWIHELEDHLKKPEPQTHKMQISEGLVDLLQRLQAFHQAVWERAETHQSLRDFIGQTAEQAALMVRAQLQKIKPRLHMEVDEACDSPWLRRILFEILPLLVTNAMDHGIEDREERRARGKAEQGLLSLSIQANPGGIHILFQDDGQGLNMETIRRKLSIASGANAIDVATAIFQPGFSTRDVVSTLSGRGVGLDAVASRIREAQGSLDIVSYQPFCLRMILPRIPS
jgi:HPt (histidine-containing phosphotransfer) domain-containing protein